MPETRSYHVAWFMTGGSPLKDVTVRISHGRVVGVETGQSSDAFDLGPVALVDGLVNAHTHLEFSLMKTPISTAGRFTDWIRAVVQYRQENPAAISASIAAGVDESLKSGTTCIGDIATVGWSPHDYAPSNFQGIVFQEILGLSPGRIDQQKQAARIHADSRGLSYRPGISPHAPYSTHRELVADAVQQAIRTGCPIAMHLAETQAELELLAHGTGDFRELLISFGIWNETLFSESQRPLDYLKVLAQAPCVLVIHGNYLAEDELQFLASQPHMTLVYCPRTHAAFGHPQHPWRRLLQLGGRVAIGTDSRASNPDLSLFAELQFLATRYPEISHLELLRLGSSAGKTALESNPTNHEPTADFTLIKSIHSPITDPDRDLFGIGNQVCGTMVDGEWLSGPAID